MNNNQLSVQQLNQTAWEGRLSDWQTSQALSQQALELATLQQDEPQRGYALRTLGFLARNQSNFIEALGQLTQALEIAREFEDAPLQRDAANVLAATFASVGNLQAALEYTQTALQINKDLNDVAGQVSNLINLCNIYNSLDRMTEAESVSLEAIQRSTDLGDSRRIAEARNNLGNAYIKLERYTEATVNLRQALVLAQESQAIELATKIRVNLAEALIHLEQFGEAEDLLLTAKKVFLEHDVFEGIAYCCLNLGLLCLHQKNPDKALGFLESGLALCQTHSMKDLEAQFHQRICTAHEQNQQFELALKHHKTFYQIEREVRRLDTERQLSAISTQRELDRARAEAELERMRRVELGHLVSQLEWQAISDPLTGLHNRRYLETHLEKSFLEAKAENKPLSVAMLDIDTFKQVNDTYGHAVGDQVLKIIAKLAKDSLRTGDIAARYGGEEFALVIHTSLEPAIRACERLRTRFETYPWDEVHLGLQVTLTIGVCADTQLENFEKMLNAADELLYVGKRNGKNQVRA